MLRPSLYDVFVAMILLLVLHRTSLLLALSELMKGASLASAPNGHTKGF